MLRPATGGIGWEKVILGRKTTSQQAGHLGPHYPKTIKSQNSV